METTFFDVTAYIIINLFLFSSWYCLLYPVRKKALPEFSNGVNKKKHSVSFTDRIIAALILSLAQIIITEMLLGVVFKKLYAMPLFLLNISVSLIVLAAAGYKTYKENPPCPPLSKGGKGGFLGKNNLCFFNNVFHEFKDKAIRFFNIIKKDFFLLFIFSLFLISVCWLIFLGYLFPSYTWDALWYHLPIVGHIIQSGAIQENPAPFLIDLFMNIFPKNMELIFLWNTIFLKSDIITDLSQLLFAIAGVLAVYSLAVKLKIKEKHAVYSSLLFFFTPLIILQSTTNYVDVAVAVLFLIAINFLMYDDSQDCSLPVFFAGLTTGILVGSKASGPLFMVILSLAAVIKNFKRIRQVIIYFLLPAVLIGGYWYIKNWILYGNPVYPMEVSILNITLFKGWFKEIIDTAHEINDINRFSPLIKPFNVWMERVHYYLYDSRLSGLGPLWLVLFLPSIVIAFFNNSERRKFLFISLVFVITFLIYPNNWNARYVIFIVGFGAVSFGLALDYFEKREWALKTFALLLAGYTFFSSTSPCIMPWQIKRFLSLPVKERTIALHAPFNIDLHARQEYGCWIWISRNIVKGNTLAYTFEPLFSAPLWNGGFSSKTVYLKSGTYNEWLETLRKNNVTYVLVRQNSEEDKWINKAGKLMGSFWWFGATPRENFKVVYSDENYKIMRFVK